MNSNIILITFLVLFALAAANELKSHKPARNHKIYEDCMKESGASVAQLEALKKGDFNSIDNKAKCFLKCLEDNKGILTNGMPNEAGIRKKIHAPPAGNGVSKDLLAKCNGLKGADECDTAYQIYKCFMQEKVPLI
ncbi:unnamed protein product [Ceratitis capitata]|uniref:(Mediterranean fruit fly) hypothetical protein n=1 Tax=Ceratitis capitata TaxID=7213 RepID=A0A811VCB6_CERCA|nr:unnamed protein product [Ceratitis capitata]